MKLAPEWLAWSETQALLAAFAAEGAELRFVGGAVRDALLGRAVQDVDAATTAMPQQVLALLKQAGITATPTGIAHGTVTAVIGKKHFEITTLRKDMACDGRHAEVAFTQDWQEDARRRDFTMNALYLSGGGEVFDYFNGRNDAAEGRVVFIGDAHDRIREDYLRILRFFRFYAHYGKTAPDAQALAACAQEAPHMKGLSPQRIQHEMLKLLAATKSHHAISFMHEQRILPHVLGFDIASHVPLRRLEEMMSAFAVAQTPAAKLAGLMLVADRPVSTQDMATRWKLSNAFTAHLQAVLELAKTVSATLSFPEQKKTIRKAGGDLFREAVLLAWSLTNDIIATSHPWHAMLTLAQQWQPPAFPVTGKDLLALGIPEGKKMGEVLRELERFWESADYKPSKTELLARAKA